MKKLFKSVVLAAATLTIAASSIIMGSCSFTSKVNPEPEPVQPKPYLDSLSISLTKDMFLLQQGQQEISDEPIEVESLDQNKQHIDAEVELILTNLDGTDVPNWIWIDSNSKINIMALEQPSSFEFYVFAQSKETIIQSEKHKIEVEIVQMQPVVPQAIEITCNNLNPTIFYTSSGNIELGLNAWAVDTPEELLEKNCYWNVSSLNEEEQFDLINEALFYLVETEDKRYLRVSENVDSSYIGNYQIVVSAQSILDENVNDEVVINLSIKDGFYYYDFITNYTYSRTSLDDEWTLSLVPTNTVILDKVAINVWDIPVSSIAANLCSISGVRQLSSLFLPDNITTINESAFANQEYMYNVAIPGVKHIGKNAFYNCINMKFALGYEQPVLGMVGDNGFYGCSSINFNENIIHEFTSIGDYAFYMTPLVSINLGLQIQSIGLEPFSNCIYLQFINILAANPPTLSGSLYAGSTNLINIRVPLNCVETYKNSEIWKIYESKIIGY